jgi:hypothetical protein
MASIFPLYSTVLSTTVALPSYAGRMVGYVSFRRALSASSQRVKLSVGLEESLIILTLSSLASSAVSAGSNLTEFSTPVRCPLWAEALEPPHS